MRKLTVEELDSQQVELLPAKETLTFHSNAASVLASNTSFAMNVASWNASAASAAVQTITVAQY